MKRMAQNSNIGRSNVLQQGSFLFLCHRVFVGSKITNAASLCAEQLPGLGAHGSFKNSGRLLEAHGLSNV
jgi:hypothetical protein